MKILAPINSIHEAEPLIASGADEFYCGLHPKAWENKYGKKVWLNRRWSSASINSFEELKNLVKVSHRNNVKVFLTLNLPFYLPEQYPEILSLVKEVTENCGIDALIVSDPGIIMTIKETFPKVEIHASSLGAILNSSSASFYQSLGASRIIFPRFADLEDLGIIINKLGTKLKYEVFILNDGCVFEEGHCYVSHAFGGAFCSRWNYELVEINKDEESPYKIDKASFKRHIKDYKEWLWIGIKNCGGVPGPKGLPLGMCGLCALEKLKDIGVSSLKIVGRESPFPKKIASVKIVKKILDHIDSSNKKLTTSQLAQNLRRTKSLCKSNFMCYYR
ncbi:MAG: family peptidase [Clostridia bacterium]|nr:family peptidase [Clostridia bacterium]